MDSTFAIDKMFLADNTPVYVLTVLVPGTVPKVILPDPEDALYPTILDFATSQGFETISRGSEIQASGDFTQEFLDTLLEVHGLTIVAS